MGFKDDLKKAAYSAVPRKIEMPDEFVSFDPHWLDVLALILHIQYTRSMQ